MKRRDKREEQKQLAENSYLLRAWKRWHRDQLEAALIGVHGDVLVQLMIQLKNLREARTLLNFIEAQDWTAIDAETRLIALHEINTAITRLRVRNDMEPFDDGFPGDRPNVFQTIRAILIPAKAAPPGAHPGSI
jgi:hypothetical protein